MGEPSWRESRGGVRGLAVPRLGLFQYSSYARTNLPRSGAKGLDFRTILQRIEGPRCLHCG